MIKLYFDLGDEGDFSPVINTLYTLYNSTSSEETKLNIVNSLHDQIEKFINDDCNQELLFQLGNLETMMSGMGYDIDWVDNVDVDFIVNHGSYKGEIDVYDIDIEELGHMPFIITGVVTLTDLTDPAIVTALRLSADVIVEEV